jgi:HJR/Mrr/RecB family endonuclease
LLGIQKKILDRLKPRGMKNVGQHLLKEIEEHKQQLGTIFLNCALNSVYNVTQQPAEKKMVSDLQIASIYCINHLLQLREQLDLINASVNPMEKTVENPDVLSSIIGFASSIGKVKKMGMECTNAQAESFIELIKKRIDKNQPINQEP